MRTHQLQGIRGLAALLVFGAHGLALFETPEWFHGIAAYSNGHAAVVIFYVLSGFVLTLSMHRQDRPAGEFYIKRIFRIYPAWIVVCTFSLLYLIFIHYRYPIPNGSQWWRDRFLAERMHPQFIAASYVGALAFLVPQGWTIFVELVGSILMPLIAYLAYRRRVLFYVAFAIALMTSLLIGARTYYGVGSYMVDFFIGAWLATPWPTAVKVVKTWHLWAVWSLIPTIVLLVAYRVIWPPVAPIHAQIEHNGFAQLVEAACSLWILFVVIYSDHQIKILDNKALLWFGETSYSFYLVHFPILCLVAQVIWPLPVSPIALSLLLLAISLPISIGVSAIMHRYVELPGIGWGKAFLVKMSPRKATDTEGG